MSDNTMKAVCFVEPYKVACEEIPKPTIVEETDVIVKLVVGAICGSDLHPYRGDEKGLDAGCPMGHEFAGIVDQIGSKVTTLKVGDKVCSPFTTSCGECFYCKEGLTCRCTQSALFGWVQNSEGLAGAQAEYIRVPCGDGTLAKLPEDISFEHSLLAGDILSTGMFCAMQGGLGVPNAGTIASPFEGNWEPARRVVLVVGCGPVGLLGVLSSCFLLEKSGERGRTTIVAVDRVPERLEMANTFGADRVLNFEKDDVLNEIKDLTDGRGADVVLELVGQKAAMKMGLDCMRPGGTFSSVGVHAYDTFCFGPEDGYDMNLTFKMGRCPARAMMPKSFELLRDEKYSSIANKLFTHRVNFLQVPEAYQKFEKQQDGMIKCLIYAEKLPEQ